MISGMTWALPAIAPAACGAKNLHVVDLEGARDGNTPNIETVRALIEQSGLAVEIGGVVRSMETVKTYIDAGAARVIIGTAAVTDPAFLDAALDTYGDKIAVGVDIRDGLVAIKGWREDDTANTASTTSPIYITNALPLRSSKRTLLRISAASVMRNSGRALRMAISPL